MKPTEKQMAYVERIINELGEEMVQHYIERFYSCADISNLNKEQAQKIITGLSSHISKPIYGVVGRDVPFGRWKM